jgi:hypothetical protein
MLTRRQALALISAAVTLMVFSAEATPLRSLPNSFGGSAPNDEFVPDRELRLTLGDRMASQSWTYSGQSYVEKRGRIVGDEGECILLTIVNDTQGLQRVDFEGALFQGAGHVGLRAGQSLAIELMLADIDRTGTIRSGGAALPIEIRPSYQSHELHLNF